MAHAYVDVGATPLKLLSICSGDESQLISAHSREAELREDAGGGDGDAEVAPPHKRAAVRS
jgi:hypothetical protein